MNIKKILNKIFNLRSFIYVLFAISIVYVGLFYFGGFVEGTEGTPIEEPLVTNGILQWAFILLIMTTLPALLSPLINFIRNPKNVTKVLITLGIVGVVIVVAYLLASDEVMNIAQYSGPDNVPATLKRADTMIFLVYILLGGALISILFTEIVRLFK